MGAAGAGAALLAVAPGRASAKSPLEELGDLRALKEEREAQAFEDLRELRATREAASRAELEVRARLPTHPGHGTPRPVYYYPPRQAPGLTPRPPRPQARLAELEAERAELEAQARSSLVGGQTLCVTPFGVDVVGITEAVALIGALVGGLSARQRKQELEELNVKLRAINVNLRQQARSSGVTYAPGLTYVPTGGTGSDSNANGAAAAATLTAAPEVTELSETRSALKEGRRLLKEGEAPGAMVQFKKALLLSRQTSNRVQERRAVRGLAACKRENGDVKGSIEDYLKVLEISQEIGDYTGDADAYGVIADLYTDLGELEKAGKYYDRYINALPDESSARTD